jgi:hypothetical protein
MISSILVLVCLSNVLSQRITKPSFFNPDSKPFEDNSEFFQIENTQGWIGCEYTPARASNELWWYNFAEYVPDINRELASGNYIICNTLPFKINFLYSRS